MNRKIMTVVLVAALALTLTGLTWADQGCADCDGQCVDYPKRAHMPMLTAEQRDEVKARAAELDEQGASPEEVRAAIAEMLKEWGIQAGVGQRGQQAAPPRWGQQGMGMMHQGQRGMGMMQQGIGMMHQGQRGMGMMQQWGQQAGPPRWGQPAAPPGWGQQAPPPRWGQQAGPPGWGQQGPPPQWGQPAPPPYWGWGQQAGPPRWGQQAPPPRWGQQAGPPGWGQQGPPPQWGQQQQAWRGQQGGYGQQAQRPGWQMIMQRLTPEQREEVWGTVKQLHEDGASGQEIREALGDMLAGWGIQLRPQSQD